MRYACDDCGYSWNEPTRDQVPARPVACLPRQRANARAAPEREWANCNGVFVAEGAAGVARFAQGGGRQGDFGNGMWAHD